MTPPPDREELAVPVAVVGMVPTMAKVSVTIRTTHIPSIKHNWMYGFVLGPLFTDVVRLPTVGGRSADHHQVLPGEDGGARGLLLPPDPPGKVVADQAGPGESLSGNTEQGRSGIRSQ